MPRKPRIYMCMLAAICSLAVNLAMRAQSAPPANGDLPTVDHILEESVTATGGRQAWMKLTSMKLKGEVTMSPLNLVGTVNISSKAPDKDSVCMTFPQGIFFCQLYDGKNGWQDDSKDGLKPLEGKSLEEMRIDSDFYSELHRKDLYADMKVLRQDKFDGLTVYVVEGTRKDGKKQELYYAKDTGLLAGEKNFGTAADDSKTSFFEDYKTTTTGILIPTKMRMITNTMTMRIVLQEIAPNAEIPDSVFAKPVKSARDASGAGDIGRPDNGKVTDGVYRNDFFGFSYTLPQGWMVHGEETQKALMEAGKALMAGDDQAKKSLMDAESKRTYHLLTAFEFPLGTPGKPNRGIQLIAENVAFAPGIQTGEDYILLMEKSLSSGQVPAQFEGDPVEQQIGGVTFYRQSVNLKIGSTSIYEIFYSTMMKRYAVSFVLNAQSKEGVEEVAKSLDTFRSPADASKP